MRSFLERVTLRFCLAAAVVAVAAAPDRTLAKGRPQAAPRETAAVETLITDSAKALTAFPRTRSIESVMAFYAKDYTGIENGEEWTADDTRQLLSDLEERIDLGLRVGVSCKASNIKVRITEAVAWATYDYSLKIGADGEALDDEEGKCTAVLEKVGGSWLFKHEHCSTLCPNEEEEEKEEPPENQT